MRGWAVPCIVLAYAGCGRFAFSDDVAVAMFYADGDGNIATRGFSSAGDWLPVQPIAAHPMAAIAFARSAYAPGSGATMLGLAETIGSGDVALSVMGPSGWSHGFSVADLGPPTSHRNFDLAFSASSGAGLAVYSDTTPSPKFRVWTAGSWSDEQPIFVTAPGTAAVDWVCLVTDPHSDEITLLYSDTSKNLYAAVWNGAAWSASTMLDTTLGNGPFPSFAGAYEDQGSELLVVWSHGTSGNGASDPIFYSTKPTGSSSFASILTSGPIPGFGPIVAASEVGTSQIAFALLENAFCLCDDFAVGLWGSSGWTPFADIDPNVGRLYENSPGTQPVGVAWLGSSGTAVAVYASGDTGLSWATRTATSSWTLQTPALISPTIPARLSFATANAPDGGVLLFIEDITGALWAKRWDGTTWTDTNLGNPIATGLSLVGQPFGVVTYRS